jgi:hypothetical protein
MESPPARAIACHRSIAVKGERAGHWARERKIGTGHARTIARTARRYEVQNMVR